METTMEMLSLKLPTTKLRCDDTNILSYLLYIFIYWPLTNGTHVLLYHLLNTNVNMPGNIYIHQYESSVAQVTACRLFDNKPLLGSFLIDAIWTLRKNTFNWDQNTWMLFQQQTFEYVFFKLSITVYALLRHNVLWYQYTPKRMVPETLELLCWLFHYIFLQYTKFTIPNQWYRYFCIARLGCFCFMIKICNSNADITLFMHTFRDWWRRWVDPWFHFDKAVMQCERKYLTFQCQHDSKIFVHALQSVKVWHMVSLRKHIDLYSPHTVL